MVPNKKPVVVDSGTAFNSVDRIKTVSGPAETGIYKGPVRFVLALAPMAEISHAAFRRLAEGFSGCDIYFTEMLSAAALLNSSPYEQYYTDLSPAPERTVVQLVGSEPENFHRAAEKLVGENPDFPGFDINMGCSIGAIRKKGWGIELMSEPEKVREILRGVRAAAPGKSLSAKIRLGFTEDERKLLDFCRMLEDEGVDFITLNPKTGKEGRNRPGRWEQVAVLRQKLGVPVWGNSDITGWGSYTSRRRISQQGAGADETTGYMIGRGAAAAPWIFAIIKGREMDPDFKLTINLEETAAAFISLLKEFQPEDFHLSRARRFFFYYTNNLRFGHRLRYDIQNAPGLSEVESLVLSYFKRNPEERVKTC